MEGLFMPHKHNPKHEFKKDHSQHVSSHSHQLFKHHDKKQSQTVQTTNVVVNIDQKEDCMSGCLSALIKCFKA